MKAIVALDNQNAIGYNNNLLYTSKEDFYWFKHHTLNKPIVMGYNTFCSLPRVLPHRQHIVFTNKLYVPEVIEKVRYTKANFGQSSDVYIVNSLAMFDQLCKNIGIAQDDCVVIGGEQIYKLFENRINTICVTHLDYEFKADVHFPIDLNKLKWECVQQSNVALTGDSNIATVFKIYKRF